MSQNVPGKDVKKIFYKSSSKSQNVTLCELNVSLKTLFLITSNTGDVHCKEMYQEVNMEKCSKKAQEIDSKLQSEMMYCLNEILRN